MEILHRYTNACLWPGDAETKKEAILKAIKDGADLSGADLAGANLSDAEISKVLSIGSIGSRGAYLVAWLMADGSRKYSTGCQIQITEDAFLARVQETHSNNLHAQDYRAAVEFAKSLHLRHAVPLDSAPVAE